MDKHITLEGQENDVTTAGLARMNMILHNFPTANILPGNTLSSPKFKDGPQLRTYDYVVANPPFSDKSWSTGLIPEKDDYQRFSWGVPPRKQGDYAYLLHIVRSMKSTGKAACILPHGVLFRGNAEGVIRKQLVLSGYLKAIIGLPANLFYGTGIPACIVVLDKENATVRKGIFMIDASKGFMKDGPKNRLRERDIHRIVDIFSRQDESDPRFARIVPLEEISNAKNDFNLNLPRYIDSTEPEDLQDIDGHLRGGIPVRDIDDPERLKPYWDVLPSIRAALFQPADRPGYCQLRLPIAEVKPAIFGHSEFTTFQNSANGLFRRWKKAHLPKLKGFAKDEHPKQLIEALSEDLLAIFKTAPLVDAYGVYQHLMDYWADIMQDDCYLIATDGWVTGAQPREILQVKNKENKLVWPEPHDFRRGNRRFKSDLVPAAILIDRYFAAERDRIADLEGELAVVEQELDEMFEEHGGEEGLLNDVVDGEGDKRKVVAKAVKPRLKAIGKDPEYDDERSVLKQYAALLDRQTEKKSKLKVAREDLDAKLDAKYPKLTEDEVKTMVVDDKWLTRLEAAVTGELDRVSQALTGRVRQLAERYATPLPRLEEKVASLNALVEGHLRQMQQLLTGQNRLPGFSGKWEVRSLFEIAERKKELFDDGDWVEAEFLTDKGVRLVQTGNIGEGYFAEKEAKKYISAESYKKLRCKELRVGDVLICRLAEPAGRTCILPDIGEERVITAVDVTIFRPSASFVDRRFLVYVFNTPQWYQAVSERCGGTTRTRIARGQLGKIEIKLPPLPEQIAIAKMLSSMDAEIEALEQRLTKTRDLKQAMMQVLLTGRIRLVPPEARHA